MSYLDPIQQSIPKNCIVFQTKFAYIINNNDDIFVLIKTLLLNNCQTSLISCY